MLCNINILSGPHASMLLLLQPMWCGALFQLVIRQVQGQQDTSHREYIASATSTRQQPSDRIFLRSDDMVSE